MSTWTDRLTLAALGPTSAAVGLAAGHLLAAATTPSASPVLAVGSTVIDATPTPVKEWAVAHFGTSDKPILIGSVLAAVMVVVVAVGPLAHRSRLLGAGVLLVLASAAGACALTRPGAQATDAGPSVIAACVSVAVLLALLRLAHGAATGVAPCSSRRGVLLGLGVTALATTGLGAAGHWLTSARGRPEDITLPAPADPAPALPRGLDRIVPGITPLRTGTRDFYRVDTRLDVPLVSSADWRLTIDGAVRRPLTLTFAELLAMPMIERDITLTCVSTSVGGPYVGGARWLGVRLTDLLDRVGVGGAGPMTSAGYPDQILSTDVDGMTISTPLALAVDGRDAMVAVGMNGAALPRAHGFPARLVIPGLYGFVGATKWVTRLTLTTYDDRSAYWTERGWATDAPIKPAGRIDTPRPLARLEPGEIVVGGVAWAQADGGVARVEVSIDGGRWQPAQLGPTAGSVYWRQWFHRWEARPGSHTLSCRVVDGNGQVQTPVRANPFPDGASGRHTITVEVGS